MKNVIFGHFSGPIEGPNWDSSKMAEKWLPGLLGSALGEVQGRKWLPPGFPKEPPEEPKRAPGSPRESQGEPRRPNGSQNAPKRAPKIDDFRVRVGNW